MYSVNFIYDLTNSDVLYYILILLLVIISLIMLYLMYTQNREITKQLHLKNNKEDEESKRNESAIKDTESLDDREELLEVSRKTIPRHLEYTQTLFSNTELQELQDITKEIESDYRDKVNSISDYEEEQEESAIISYDELLSKTQVIPIVKKEAVSDDIDYRHEEKFLNKLKELNNKLK